VILGDFDAACQLLLENIRSMGVTRGKKNIWKAFLVLNLADTVLKHPKLLQKSKLNMKPVLEEAKTILGIRYGKNFSGIDVITKTINLL